MNAKQQLAYQTGYQWAQTGRSLEDLLPGAQHAFPKSHLKFWREGYQDYWKNLMEPEPGSEPEPEPPPDLGAIRFDASKIHVFRDDQIPDASWINGLMPWIQHYQLPEGSSTATVISQAIEYVELGVIETRFKSKARQHGVILVPPRVSENEDNWSDRMDRGFKLITRVLTGWPVVVEDENSGSVLLEYVQLPDDTLPTVMYDWHAFRWMIGAPSELVVVREGLTLAPHNN